MGATALQSVLKISAEFSVSPLAPPPPTTSTRPSWSVVDVCRRRAVVIAGAVFQVSVTGSLISTELSMPDEPWPPATSTVPSGRSDAVWNLRGVLRLPKGVHVPITGSTVTVVAPDTFPRVAVIVALPIPVPVTRPGLPVLATVAIVSDDEIQLAKMRS